MAAQDPTRQQPDEGRVERRRRRRGVVLGAGVLTVAALALAGCGDSGTPTPTTPTQPAKPSASVGGANTAEVVAAAEAFLKTLSPQQRETVLYELGDPSKRAGWSNFPVGVTKRNGIAFGDLNPRQQAAALGVMKAALSVQGYEELVGIRESDNYLKSLQEPGEEGAPGGFGANVYYLAFFGAPSTKQPFMVQFGATTSRTASPTTARA